MLALPYKRYIYRFDGDFHINGKPLLLNHSSQTRPADTAVHGDTGCAVWDSAVHLAKYLESNPLLVKEKHVLELGAGLGLCGIACALLDAENVTLTDLEYILAATWQNVSKNNLRSDRVRVTQLDWTSTDLENLPSIVDVIIASDTVWIESLVDPFVNILEKLTSRYPQATIILANQKRSDLVWRKFTASASIIFEILFVESEGNLEVYTLKRLE